MRQGNRATASPWHRVILSCCHLVILILLLTACNTPAEISEPAAATASPEAAAGRETRGPAAPVATPSATPFPVATFTAELSATIAASLPPTPTADPEGIPSFGDIANANVLPLDLGSDRSPAWAVYTYGMRGIDPQQEHFVAVYTHDGSWQEVSRMVLDTADYVDAQGVTVTQLAPEQGVWLNIQSGIGAHGGCFDLLRFDGTALTSEVASCNSSPFAGELRDLDGDGTPEVLLNQTDYYVFCYACGVRTPQFQVLRWDGEQLVEVALTPLGDNAPDDMRRLNNRAVALAQGGLWKDAQATIAEIDDLDANGTAYWNAQFIRLHAEARAEQAQDGSYPLLSHIFYGDYTAALDVLRPYSVEELFSTPNPLVVETVAETWEPALTDWITTTTTQALQARPDLAAAFFLRGWGRHLTDPGSSAVRDDIRQAAQLDPAEPLFAQSLAYLDGPPPADEAGEPDAAPPEDEASPDTPPDAPPPADEPAPPADDSET